MKRALIPLLLTPLLWTGPTAQAVTHSPCAYRYASPPALQLIVNGQSTLAGSGTVGACPSPVGSESVTVTVSLERYDGTAWVAVSPAVTVSRGWSRITRGARQVSATATAACVPGQWRTRLVSFDSAPIDVTSTPVTFTAGDSGVCGSYAAAVAHEFCVGRTERDQARAEWESEQAAIEWAAAAVERVLDLCDEADGQDAWGRVLAVNPSSVRAALLGES